MALRRNIIAIFSIVSMILLSGCATHAQRRMPTAEEMVNRMVNQMKQELNLTDAQVNQILPIVQGHVQKQKELIEQVRGKGRGAMGTIRTDMEKLNQQTDAKLAEFLSKEQLAKWKETRIKAKESGGRKPW